MKFKHLLMCAFMCLICMSCIQDEPLNAECDILECFVPGDLLKMDPQIENDRIFLMLKPTINLDTTDIAIDFVLTPGATIDPPSGTPRNFKQPQTYVVTSENKKYHKAYTISCSTDGIVTKYGFEHVELNSTKKYYIFYEVQNNQKQYIWASGNAGFEFIASKAQPEDYPTTPYDFGKDGKCVKMETKSTGVLGQIAKMPIAAGSLFIGEFISAMAMTQPLQATHFGVPFDFIPVCLKGSYQYKPGPVYTEKDGSVNPNKTDIFDIYAILYETDEQVKYLDGSNFLTSPNLISIARLGDEDKVISNDWTDFKVFFKMQPGKTIEIEKLLANKYNVSIVMTSSINGNLFQGAVGSVLLVDEVELVHF